MRLLSGLLASSMKGDPRKAERKGGEDGLELSFVLILRIVVTEQPLWLESPPLREVDDVIHEAYTR
ncbi:hypothetical protein COW95_02455 [Candidatus Peregrinibacteria bacterium CG22_combo_CG10-13_8_21_14_all_49_11]|nr:MAG: hypothetical protein COW95_02455 [Candidatus Peregrinibacteria bacterium CG22_combo_CG10-13_8_21_14_all_49_11]